MSGEKLLFDKIEEMGGTIEYKDEEPKILLFSLTNLKTKKQVKLYANGLIVGSFDDLSEEDGIFVDNYSWFPLINLVSHAIHGK